MNIPMPQMVVTGQLIVSNEHSFSIISLYSNNIQDGCVSYITPEVMIIMIRGNDYHDLQ